MSCRELPEIAYCPRCGASVQAWCGNPNRFLCERCGHIQYRNPAPCVSVLIVDEERVLLGRRGNTSIQPGRWCLPCGHVEGEENFLDAARREVREETGLEISLLSIINVTANHFLEGIHSMVVVLLAEPTAGCLQAGDDLTEVRWFPLEGPFPDMAFKADVHIIEQRRRLGPRFGIPLESTESEFFES